MITRSNYFRNETIIVFGAPRVFNAVPGKRKMMKRS